MKKLKKEWHWFLLTDYEREEEFLRRKHQMGERFVQVKLPGVYYFEPCTPEDMVYRLDFNPQKVADRESYRKMYEDYGWTYLQDLNEFSYFRKPAADLAEDNQIFSDMESKLAMLQRIFCKRMLPIMLVFLAAVLPGLRYVMSGDMSGIGAVILQLIYVLLFAADIYVILRCAIGFHRLKKKYRGEE